MDARLTIMTPTYNRSELLFKLYESLVKQTNKSFIWLIIDDGSTDDTGAMVEELIEQNEIVIKYVYQDNSGKYVAHNNGVKMCETELFLCVDSDDYVLEDGVEKILKIWDAYKNDNRIAGILTPRKMSEGQLLLSHPLKSKMMNLYNKKQLKGETALVFRSLVLKKFLFPEISGEKFMTETVIYHRIDEQYKMIVKDEYIVGGEYQKGGLSNTAEINQWNSPINALISFKVNAAYQTSFKKAVKASGCYYAWKKIRKIEKCNLYKEIPIYIRIASFILIPHYYRVFRALELRIKGSK